MQKLPFTEMHFDMFLPNCGHFRGHDIAMEAIKSSL